VGGVWFQFMGGGAKERMIQFMKGGGEAKPKDDNIYILLVL